MLEEAGWYQYQTFCRHVGVNCVVMPINNSGPIKISSDGHSEKEI